VVCCTANLSIPGKERLGSVCSPYLYNRVKEAPGCPPVAKAQWPAHLYIFGMCLGFSTLTSNPATKMETPNLAMARRDMHRGALSLACRSDAQPSRHCRDSAPAVVYAGMREAQVLSYFAGGKPVAEQL
jgi:hypothetical protein